MAVAMTSPVSVVPPLLERAFVHHRAGRIDQADRAYRAVLAEDPVNGTALRNLGVLSRMEGRFAQAETLYRAALGMNPKDAAAWQNFGNLLRATARREEAAEALKTSFLLEPVGAVLAGLADLLVDLARLEEAESFGRIALTLQPESGLAQMSLGRVHFQTGRFEEALRLFTWATHTLPGEAAPHTNCSAVLLRLRRPGGAMEHLVKARKIAPEAPDVHYFQANIHHHHRQLGEAVAALSRTLALKPEHGLALYQMGCIQHEFSNPNAAAAALERLLILDPQNVDGLCVLSNVQMARCAWDQLPTLRARLEALVQQGSDRILPFVLMCLGSGPQAQHDTARQFMGREIALYADTPRRPHHRLPPLGERRIRIGYLSADYHDHATAWLIAGLLERHDRSRFEIVCLSYGRDNGSVMRSRIRAGVEHFVDLLELTVPEIANRIAALEIDILVDLKGFTTGAQPGLLALKPVPILVNWLGYPGTFGTDLADYVVVDQTIVPPEEQACFSERVVYLPDSYQVNDDRRPIAPPPPSRAAVGLPTEGFVFCCFNNLYKVTAPVFAVWMRLLQAVPGSVLWLLDANPAAVAALRDRAVAAGIAPDRLRFAEKKLQADHLARLILADLFLDTLPVNAHTTASDALWAGLPVLTCMGDSLIGRVAASLLRAIGLPELVTDSLDAYEDTALRLARNPEMLAALRERLAVNRRTHPLFDTARFTRSLEAAYTRMYAIAAADGTPEPFTVPPEEEREELPHPPEDPTPRWSAALLERAFAAHRGGRPVEAEADYRRTLVVSPAQHDAAHLLGMIAKAQDCLVDAQRWIGRAIALRPDSAVFYANRGNTRIALRDLTGALEDYRAAAGADPHFPEGHAGQGDALLALGRLDEAAAALRRALALKPGERVMRRLAEVYSKRGRVDEAAELLRRATAAPPSPRSVAGDPRPFHIVTVKPPGYPPAAAFDEVAAMLVHGLRALGHTVECVDNILTPQTRTILLGSHLLPQEALDRLPPDTILFNLEQVLDIPRLAPFLQVARRHRVWDYSPRNIAALTQILGTDRPPSTHVPIGFVPELTRIPAAETQDIDVLFYGSLNPRRAAVLKALEGAGLRVVTVFNTYGAERDALIARAKLVLNLHFYDTRIFEIVRVFYLMANAKAVVSECDPDTEIDADLRGGLELVPYDGVVSACLRLVRDSAARRRLEAAAFEVISRHSAPDALRAGIAALDSPPPVAAPVRTPDPQPVRPLMSEPVVRPGRGLIGIPTLGAAVAPHPAMPPVASLAAARPAPSPASAALPARLNLGSGKSFDADAFNVDINPQWKPDLVIDMARPDLLGSVVDTRRFGQVTLRPGLFREIVALEVLEHVPELTRLMTNCLELLTDDGLFRISVPYDLSYGAWQDPTHVRAFNERSWLYYTDWFWYLGWTEARFDLRACTFTLSPLGERLRAAGMPDDELTRTPRAVDGMSVELRKRRLTAEERGIADRWGQSNPG